MLFYSLVQWLKHSRKEYCELCKHRFAFTPSKYMWHGWIIHCNILNSFKFPKQALKMGPYGFPFLIKCFYMWQFNLSKVTYFVNNRNNLQHYKQKLSIQKRWSDCLWFTFSPFPLQFTPQTCHHVSPFRTFVPACWPVWAQQSVTGSITHWWPLHGSVWFLSLHVSSICCRMLIHGHRDQILY